MFKGQSKKNFNCLCLQKFLFDKKKRFVRVGIVSFSLKSVWMQTGNQTMRYVCSVCDKGYDVYATYYSHKTTHLPPAIACATCSKVFRTKAQLYRHAYLECTPEKPKEVASRLQGMFGIDRDKW